MTLAKWAKAVKALADNRCNICGSTENLQAHHIMPKNLYPDHIYDLNNGLCLCRKCHYYYHNGRFDYHGNEWQGIQYVDEERYKLVKDYRDKLQALQPEAQPEAQQPEEE